MAETGTNTSKMDESDILIDDVFMNDVDHLDLTEELNALDRGGESAGGDAGAGVAAGLEWYEALPVIPCREKDSEEKEKDKDGNLILDEKTGKPIPRFKAKRPLTLHGVYDASSAPERIAAWKRRFPGCMWGLPTGKGSGFWVLDLDRNHTPGVDGVKNFEQYCFDHGHEVPQTATVITGNDGRHLYFRMPPDGTDIGNGNTVLPGIEFKGTGGYVIKPPSMSLETAKAYEWEDPTVPIAFAPDWLLALITRKKKPAPSANVAQAAGPVDAVRALGEKIAGTWETKLAEIRSAEKGSRNPTLNKNACCLYGLAKAGKLTKEFIDLALWDAAHAMKTPLPDVEIGKTLNSAWGGANPWPTGTGGAVEVDDLAEDESIGGDEIQTRPMDWLWKGVFIRKAVNLINGKGGRGKSQLRARITAHVTTGTPWPDGSPCPQGKVLIVCLEDSLEEIEKPRLMAAGADVSLCRFLYGHKTISTIKKDIRKIEATIIKHGITVLFVDPLLGYTNDVTNKDIAAAREVVDLLTELAARHNLAVIAINHITKGGGNAGFDPMDRISGNSGIGHAARTSWFVTKDTEDPRSNRRLFLCGKNNPSLDTIGFSFTIEPATVESDEGPCEVSRAVWEEGMVDIDAAYALNRDEKLMIRNGDGEPQNEKERAAAFLLEVLADGPVDSNRIKEMGKDADISWRTIWRAKEDLSIKCKRVIDEGGTRWQWSINEAASTPDWVDNITVKGRSVPSMPTVPSIPYKENGTVDGTERTMPASVPNGLYGKVGTLGTDGTVEPNTGTPIPPTTTTDSKLQGVDI